MRGVWIEVGVVITKGELVKYVKLIAIAVLSTVMVACQKPDRHKETLALSDGSKVALSDLDGKWVVVTYWDTWRRSAKVDMAALNALHKLDPKHIKVFGYNYMDLHGKELLSAMKQFNVQFDEFENIPADLLGLPEEVDSMPATFVLSPSGQLVKTLYGPQSLVSLKKALV